MERKLAAYPLFIKDPYYSIWTRNEELVGNNPIFWVGDSEKPMRGYIVVDGEEYTFLGKGEKKLTQHYIKTEACITECYFTGDLFDLKLEFISPLAPEQLELTACPVCYLKYTVTAKKELKNAVVRFEIDEAICYNTERKPDRHEITSATVVDYGKFEDVYVGL